MRNQPTITAIRPMTEEELDNEGWGGTPHWHIPYVIEMSDGTIYYPSQDPEGNGPGAWFILDPEGEKSIHTPAVRDWLKGRIVIAIHQTQPHVMSLSGWDGEDAPPCFAIQGGISLYPSRDDEGNGPGCVFGIDSDGDAIMLGASQ